MIPCPPINTDRHNHTGPATTLNPAGVWAGRIYLSTKLCKEGALLLRCLAASRPHCNPCKQILLQATGTVGFCYGEKKLQFLHRKCVKAGKNEKVLAGPKNLKKPPRGAFPIFLLSVSPVADPERRGQLCQGLGKASLAERHQIQTQLFQTRKLLKIRISGDICTAELERDAMDL